MHAYFGGRNSRREENDSELKPEGFDPRYPDDQYGR